MLIIFSYYKNTACQPPTPSCDFSPDLRTVPGVLLPPPGVPGPPDPAFFVSRLLKKLASTPSLVWPAEHKHTGVTKKTHSNSHLVIACGSYAPARTRLRHGVGHVGRSRSITRPGGASRCSGGGVLQKHNDSFCTRMLRGRLYIYLESQN